MEPARVLTAGALLARLGVVLPEPEPVEQAEPWPPVAGDEPYPPRRLMLELAEARSRGWPFELAWATALKRAEPDYDWKVALSDTRESWHDAYERRGLGIMDRMRAAIEEEEGRWTVRRS